MKLKKKKHCELFVKNAIVILLLHFFVSYGTISAWKIHTIYNAQVKDTRKQAKLGVEETR